MSAPFPAVRFLSADDCERAVAVPALLDEIARGFVDHSAGRVTVPPVGHLGLADPPGDVHITYGHVRGDDALVIKVATGFPANAARGLPTGDGLMLAFDARTGLLDAVLLDHARLTDLRTAAAGAVAAGTVRLDAVRERGEPLAAPVSRGAGDITLCDRTGVAVQDVVIARHVLRRPGA